ncbi:hypothetical protein [Leifsonia sp. Leaf264]|uniref:hypothetical protein n=1 Tax=Leifsonia sp. Leaf264 TaxID=1736314 RepID=UPI0006FF5E49|nr:hypothetical protein [Leifsonia sp. Leaf264]KQO98608.1 hypothetical protein ASF30_11135 [Leifsonia sp. Leaf264]
MPQPTQEPTEPPCSFQPEIWSIEFVDGAPVMLCNTHGHAGWGEVYEFEPGEAVGTCQYFDDPSTGDLTRYDQDDVHRMRTNTQHDLYSVVGR